MERAEESTREREGAWKGWKEEEKQRAEESAMPGRKYTKNITGKQRKNKLTEKWELGMGEKEGGAEVSWLHK